MSMFNWTKIDDHKEISFIRFDYYKTQSGLSRNQIKARMHELGVRTNAKKKHDQRKWYAEDVADIMESISSIGHELTAKFYNVTVRLIKKLVCNANRYGFDAYPLRNSQ